MSQAHDLALSVHELLLEYVDIEEKLFSQKLFQKVDYATYELVIDDILTNIQEHQDQSFSILKVSTNDPEIDVFFKQLSIFLNALKDTSILLKEICHKLYLKSENKLRYSIFKYNSDLNNLRRLEIKHQDIGNKLNKYLPTE